MPHPVTIDYTNHAGKRALRRIEPRGIRYGTTPKDPKPAWVLDALDLEKGVERSFNLGRIHSWDEG